MATGQVETAAGTALATYVYGVVASDAAPASAAAGISGTDVHVLPYRDVSALVSVVPIPIRAKRRELMSHSEVVNEAARTTTVLPLRFGTTFPDGDTVVSDFLEPRHDELSKLLDQFDGRVELMVKAFYREEAILAEIVRDDPRVARLRAATQGRPAAQTQAEQLELGSAVAAALQARTSADAASILETLRPFAIDVWVDETPIEHQVLRASILVERENVEATDAALSALAERNAGRIQFKYIGPLAPHSFVSLSGEAS
jgi:gas vesicle protein GvpL/GvpF